MCPEEDYSTVVETLTIDDNWCKNLSWNWRNQKSSILLTPQKVLNSHQKVGSEHVRLDADHIILVFSPHRLGKLVGWEVLNERNGRLQSSEVVSCLVLGQLWVTILRHEVEVCRLGKGQGRAAREEKLSDVQVCHQRLSIAFDLLLIFLCSLIQTPTLTPPPNNALLTNMDIRGIPPVFSYRRGGDGVSLPDIWKLWCHNCLNSYNREHNYSIAESDISCP